MSKVKTAVVLTSRAIVRGASMVRRLVARSPQAARAVVNGTARDLVRLERAAVVERLLSEFGQRTLALGGAL